MLRHADAKSSAHSFGCWREPSGLPITRFNRVPLPVISSAHLAPLIVYARPMHRRVMGQKKISLGKFRQDSLDIVDPGYNDDSSLTCVNKLCHAGNGVRSVRVSLLRAGIGEPP